MTQKVIIADASPLIALSRINHIHLIRELFGEVVITEIVRDEILAGGHADSLPVKDAIEAGWMVLVEAADLEEIDDKSVSLGGLDAGEKSSLQLALARKSDSQSVLLIIDEVKGRRAALNLSLELIGSAGIIALAKRKGLVQEAGTLLTEMKDSGYYLSDSVVDMALKIAGEK